MLSFFKKFFLDPKKNPKHIAVIMDGNGRWAQKRHMPRSYGHAKGLNSVQKMTDQFINEIDKVVASKEKDLLAI